VHLTNSSVIIYEKESYIADLAKDAKSNAINHFFRLVRGLERHLKADFSTCGQYKFRVTRQHYALIKNALAKQYDEKGQRLELYAANGIWFVIDNSYNLKEAETVNPKDADIDNEKVQNFFNSLKVRPITSGELTVALANTPTDNQALLVFCQTPTRIVEFVSRTGASVVLKVRKSRYDRTDQGGAGVGSVTGQPVGVTLVTGASYSTSSIGSAVNDGSGQTTSPPHSHTVGSMFQHDHTNIETDLPAVSSEAVLVTVGYAF
jgi:hypothetical protein